MKELYNCRRDCCPKMYLDEATSLIHIEDDFGSEVKLKKEQFDVLKDAFEKYFKRADDRNART